jgi:hypothetical protein
VGKDKQRGGIRGGVQKQSNKRSSIQLFDISILRNTPELLAWGIGIVLAVLMVRRGGSKAEKLLLAGCSVMFITSLASPFVRELVYSLASLQDMSNRMMAQTMGWATLPLGILSLGGLVCTVIAFWVRFRIRRQESG